MAVNLPPIPPSIQALGRAAVNWLQAAVNSIAAASDSATDSSTNLDVHAAATAAHGSLGNIVGTGNPAQAALRGAVFRAAANSDSTATTTSADAPAQGAGYVQANVQAIATLANELKADHNALLATVNSLQAKLRAAGIMA